MRTKPSFLLNKLTMPIAVLLMIMGISLPVQALVVLQYHHVSETTPKSTSVTPARFAEHMRWLKDNQYQVVSMHQLLKWLEQGEPIPNKAAVITFDDGYTSIYDIAWPILKKNKWPFTVFINTKPHDEKNQQFMSWKQLQTLAKDGVVIGNHSVSHAHLVRKLENETEKRWRARVTHEITAAQQRIQQQLGEQPKVFAYPFGEYNRGLQRILSGLGYVAFGQQSGPIAPIDQATALPRFPFGGDYGAKDDFSVKVSSKPLPIDEAVLVDEKGNILSDPLLPEGVHKPALHLSGSSDILSKIQCFAGGKKVDVSIDDGRLLAQVNERFPAGRSRYNCTAPAAQGFYWYSQLIIKKPADGGWYEE